MFDSLSRMYFVKWLDGYLIFDYQPDNRLQKIRYHKTTGYSVIRDVKKQPR
jgi:hypothetical protein